MSTTTKEAIDNAARILRTREQGLVKTYGTVGNEAVSLAKGWAALARAVAYSESVSEVQA